MVMEARPLTVEEEVFERFAGSAALYERAKTTLPSGVTHDSRYAEPFPLYITRAKASRKWDVDGNEYVDYWGGHGALLLGHCHPAVTEAVVRQAQLGTHLGGNTELEMQWAELVTQIVPSADVVKFTSSGTEATMMAMRLARAFTGRDRIIKTNGHFHGWHDYAAIAMLPPYDVPISKGIPKAVQDTVTGVPHLDLAALEAELAKGDVAGVIHWGNGLTESFARDVIPLTRRYGALTIFDEVVTGFRYAPGGAQEFFGVKPELTTLAKILAGGYPGGAVAGSREVMSLFEFRDDPQWLRFGRIAHPGTFNANPVSAAAGTACLNIVKDPSVQKTAAARADAIKAGFLDVLKRHGVGGTATGWASMVDMTLNSELPARKLQSKFQAAMRLAGVDPMGMKLIVSAVHTEEDVDRTVSGYESAIKRLKEEGAVTA
ncbi:MAG: aminotransferase class III-fold pyridoxal phosphate-dependent enzyme [Chloroflexota bacterium]